MTKKLGKSIKEIRNVIVISLILCFIVYGTYKIVTLAMSPTDVFVLEKGYISKIEQLERLCYKR